MKFILIALLALLTFNANAQIHGSTIPYDDVSKIVGSNQVLTSSLENEDVRLYFLCDSGIQMVVDMGDEWIDPDTYYPLDEVRITNDPSWVRISTSARFAGVSLGRFIMDTEWNGNHIRLTQNFTATYPDSESFSAAAGLMDVMYDMILTEKPIYVLITTGSSLPIEYRIWYRYTFPIKGIGKALATIPRCKYWMEEL